MSFFKNIARKRLNTLPLNSKKLIPLSRKTRARKSLLKGGLKDASNGYAPKINKPPVRGLITMNPKVTKTYRTLEELRRSRKV